MLKTGIFVMGSGRSGTSMVTGAIHLCGAEIGAPLMVPSIWNPKGFMELYEAHDINERIFHQLGTKWDHLEPLPSHWLDSELAIVSQRQIKELVERQFGTSANPLWVLKDPRLSRLFPLWHGALKGQPCRAVICVRHPAEVIQSFNLFSTDKDTPKDLVHMLLYWIQSNLLAERVTREVPRYVVDFDSMISQPIYELEQLAMALDISWPAPPTTVSEQLEDWIEPSLKRVIAPEQPSRSFDFPVWMELAVQLFEKFRDQKSFAAPSQWESFDRLWEEIADVMYQNRDYSAKERLHIAEMAKADRIADILSRVQSIPVKKVA